MNRLFPGLVPDQTGTPVTPEHAYRQREAARRIDGPFRDASPCGPTRFGDLRNGGNLPRQNRALSFYLAIMLAGLVGAAAGLSLIAGG